MAYSTASNMNSLHKSPIITSLRYQVTLTIIRKKTVHIYQSNCLKLRSVGSQFSVSHSGAQSTTPQVHCLVRDMLQQSDQQRRVWACSRHAHTRWRWHPRLYSPLDSGRDYSVATMKRGVAWDRSATVSRVLRAGSFYPLAGRRMCLR